MKNTFFNELLTKGGTEIITSEINEVIIPEIPKNSLLDKSLSTLVMDIKNQIMDFRNPIMDFINRPLIKDLSECAFLALGMITVVSFLIQSIDCIVKKDFKAITRVLLVHIAILLTASVIRSSWPLQLPY